MTPSTPLLKFRVLTIASTSSSVSISMLVLIVSLIVVLLVSANEMAQVIVDVHILLRYFSIVVLINNLAADWVLYRIPTKVLSVDKETILVI
jgi:hypothetical protein